MMEEDGQTKEFVQSFEENNNKKIISWMLGCCLPFYLVLERSEGDFNQKGNHANNIWYLIEK